MVRRPAFPDRLKSLFFVHLRLLYKNQYLPECLLLNRSRCFECNMKLSFDFRFHIVGDDHHSTDEFLKRFYLDTQIILFTKIRELVVTVMAGGYDDLRPRRLNLIGLDFTRSHPSCFKRWTHRNIAPSPPATVVMIPVGCHVPEVIRQLLNNIPRFFR